jgi:hypothetical protein
MYRCEGARGGTDPPGVVQTAEKNVVEEVKVIFIQKVFHKIDIFIFFQLEVYELKVISLSFF